MNRHIDSFSSQLNGVIPEFYSTQGWNLFLRRNLNVWEVEILCLLFQLLSNIILGYNKIDSIIWNGHPTGLFTVRSCYSLLEMVSWPWRKIWFSKAPLKVSCFTWIVAREACLTNSNLQKREFQHCSRCPQCEEHSEDVGHLFLHSRVDH